MVNPFAETPEEKKELALHMHHNRHTYREICKEVRLSPSTLSRIIKEDSGIVEDSQNKMAGKSKEAKALALYDQDKVPLEAAIELDITTDQAIDFYQKFQQITCIPLENRRLHLQKEIEAIESARDKVNSHLMYLRNQIAEQSRILQDFKSQTKQCRNELFVLYCQRNQLLAG